MGRLAGKVAVIFGGSGGIGGASVRLFAAEGAQLVVADMDEGPGRQLCEELGAGSSAVPFVKVDITSPEDVKRAFATAIDAFGRIDVVYNCVGGSSLADGLIENVDDEEFWRSIKVDLYGTWLACKYGIPEVVKAGGGAIINMSSAAAVRGQNGVNAYSAAKGGVSALTRALAKGYARHGVRVNAIAPGAVGTPRVAAMLEASESVRSNVLGVQQLGVIDPAEIAALAVHLASDEARHTTGQILSVDGGLTV